MLDIEKLKEIVVEAGKIAMKYYDEDYDIQKKHDDSPVTEADFAVNDYISSSLENLYPNISIISEENCQKENLQASKQGKIFIIDPIDGTKAFISKESQFTINIGYVEGGKFLLGFIYVPILDILYYSDYQNSYKIINVQDAKILKKDGNDLNNGIIQISSLGRGEQKILLEEFKSLLIKKNIHSASSYKFCLIAEGVADFYPRRGNMKIWDVAAAFGILKFLNYQFLDLEGNEITLQTMIKDFSIPSFNLFRSQEVVDYIKINLLNSFNSSSE